MLTGSEVRSSLRFSLAGLSAWSHSDGNSGHRVVGIPVGEGPTAASAAALVDRRKELYDRAQERMRKKMGKKSDLMRTYFSPSSLTGLGIDHKSS